MIRSGCIKELDYSTGKRGSVINFCLPGEMLSLQSLGSVCSNTTSVAVEASFVCVVPWAAFNSLCAESPSVAAEFIRLIAKAGTAARDLLTLIRDKEAIRGVREREFRLGMNRDDIADYLGLRSETISRCFTELARRGLIKVRAKRVQILQAAELRSVFYSD